MKARPYTVWIFLRKFDFFLLCTFKNSNFPKFCWVIRTQPISVLKLFLLYYITKRTRGIAEILHSLFITSKLISFCTFWWRKGVSKRTALNLPWFFSYKQNWMKIFIRQIFVLYWILKKKTSNFSLFINIEWLEMIIRHKKWSILMQLAAYIAKLAAICLVLLVM